MTETIINKQKFNEIEFKEKITNLIDQLKGICASFGLGNDGNEFKIITQVFLYKFLNDKFAYEVKKLESRLANAENWEQEINEYSEEEYEMLLLRLPANTAKLQKEHFISNLSKKRGLDDFSKFFDDTLTNIGKLNKDIFSVKTEAGTKLPLFEPISNFISDESKRSNFCISVIDKLTAFSFEAIFTQKYDFYATIFEYLIKDYNKDGGGKYAEYYTPHAVAKIMAAILVNQPNTQNVTCYDPSAGSGTLLINIANKIGVDKCTIYSQDISQKSTNLLRLNLTLNNLIHSLNNIIQGNTILSPYHRTNGQLSKFDYIVSNPPFKLDFSDFVDSLDTKENHERFSAGIPSVPKKKKDSMAIYTLFLQHIMYSLSPKGKAAIVVPTGFITAQTGIDKKIREQMIEKKMLAGVVSMPSNIFATTGTNVSILFLDKKNDGNVVLIDASNLGTKIKDGKNQKTVLSETEEDQIITMFNDKKAVEDLSVVVSYEDIKTKNYSFSAGQYFEVKIEYTDITEEEFNQKMNGFTENLNELFSQSKTLEQQIQENLKNINYNN